MPDPVMTAPVTTNLFIGGHHRALQLAARDSRCLAAYVHGSRKREVVDGLAHRLQKVRLGYGLDEATTMGPLHSSAQKAFVCRLIDEAEVSRAEVLEFGELPGGGLEVGNFVRPAVIVDPDTHSIAFLDETAIAAQH